MGARRPLPKIAFLVLLATASISGCGAHETSAPVSQGNEDLPPSSSRREPPEAPFNLQTEQKLEPLTKPDADLYLQVMRTAAERVKHLTPSDRATLHDARAILAASAQGKVPSMQDAQTLERANLVAFYMDQIVAADMKIDARRYRGIAEAVESALPDAAGSGALPAGPPPIAEQTATPIEGRLDEIKAANKKFLEPNQSEIESLVKQVRNPANLPQ